MELPTQQAWFNSRWGSIQELKIPLSDRGLNLGDGIFETILVLNKQPKLLKQHLKRWASSAQILAMKSPPPDNWIEEIIHEAIDRTSLFNGNGVVRLNWSRGDSNNRGINISKESNDRFWLEINAYSPKFNPITTILSRHERRNANSKISQCKTFNYSQSIQARKEALSQGFNDALLLSTNSEICCGTTANLIIKRKGHWLTPRLASGCLPGVMRQQGVDYGLIKEMKLSAEPQDEDEWFLINSLSCHPINLFNDQRLTTLSNSKELWFLLLNQET